MMLRETRNALYDAFSYSICNVDLPALPSARDTDLTLTLLQENATSGEHLWVDTSISGDFCYVGESECTVHK